MHFNVLMRRSSILLLLLLSPTRLYYGTLLIELRASQKLDITTPFTIAIASLRHFSRFAFTVSFFLRLLFRYLHNQDHQADRFNLALVSTSTGRVLRLIKIGSRD